MIQIPTLAIHLEGLFQKTDFLRLFGRTPGVMRLLNCIPKDRNTNCFGWTPLSISSSKASPKTIICKSFGKTSGAIVMLKLCPKNNITKDPKDSSELDVGAIYFWLR